MEKPYKARPKEAASKLKALRLQRRLSLQDIYQKTRIRPEILKSIEEGGPLRPSKSYLRFFVKAYARVLEWDEEEALKDFFKEEAAPPPPAPPMAKPKGQGGGIKARAATTALFLLAGLSIALFYIGAGFLREKPASKTALPGKLEAANPPAKAAGAGAEKRAADEAAKMKPPPQPLSERPLSALIEEGFYANSLFIKSQTDKTMYFKAEGGKTATIALKGGLWHMLKAPGAIYIRLDGRSRLALAHKGRLSFWAAKNGFEKTVQAP